MAPSRELTDTRFGPVTVTTAEDRWTVEVGGRILGFDPRNGPIDGADGTGHAWQGREAFLRRTFDGHAILAGRRYRLRHESGSRARLVRDRTTLARLGAPTGDERPDVLDWGQAYGPFEWLPGTPDATDARVGHLLATFVGAGAAGAVRRTVGGFFESGGWLGP